MALTETEAYRLHTGYLRMLKRHLQAAQVALENAHGVIHLIEDADEEGKEMPKSLSDKMAEMLPLATEVRDLGETIRRHF